MIKTVIVVTKVYETDDGRNEDRVDVFDVSDDQDRVRKIVKQYVNVTETSNMTVEEFIYAVSQNENVHSAHLSAEVLAVIYG